MYVKTVLIHNGFLNFFFGISDDFVRKKSNWPNILRMKTIDFGTRLGQSIVERDIKLLPFSNLFSLERYLSTDYSLGRK